MAPATPPKTAPAIEMRKVDVVLTKNSPTQQASIDLHKGDPVTS